jgi:uncharacterized protein YjeT (DUF2065 family)
MQTSAFLARLIGPVFLLVGIGLLANPSAYRMMAEEFLRSRALLYLSGILTMPIGLAIVLTHNVWTTDWRVIITILGWLAAAGGALRMVFPQTVEIVGRRMLDQHLLLVLGGGVWFAIGALLCLFGYFW